MQPMLADDVEYSRNPG